MYRTGGAAGFTDCIQAAGIGPLRSAAYFPSIATIGWSLLLADLVVSVSFIRQSRQLMGARSTVNISSYR